MDSTEYPRTRDVRLTGDELAALIDAGTRHRRMLAKRLQAHGGSKPNMIRDLERDLAAIGTAVASLQVAKQQMDRQTVAAVRERLGMDR